MVTLVGPDDRDPKVSADYRAMRTASTQRILDDVAFLAEWCRARGREVVLDRWTFDNTVQLWDAVIPDIVGPLRPDAVAYVLEDPTRRVLVTVPVVGTRLGYDVPRPETKLRDPHPDAIHARISKSPLSGSYYGIRVLGAETLTIRDGLIREELGVAATITYDNDTSFRVIETNSGFEIRDRGTSFPIDSLARALAYIGEGRSPAADTGIARNVDGREPRIISVDCASIDDAELARLLKLDRVPPVINGTRWMFSDPPAI